MIKTNIIYNKQLFLVIKMKHKCNFCGKEFNGRKERKFCSEKCFRKSQKSRIESRKKNCLYCGKEFIPQTVKSKYCSFECADKAKITKVKKICETCGKEYLIQKSQAERSKYCSHKCHDIAKIKIQKRICKVCGKEFEVIPSRKQVCCSHKCASELQRVLNKQQEKEVINLYLNCFWTVPQLAIKFNCGKTSIHRLFKRNNIKERGYGQHTRLFNDKTEDKICKLYLDGKTTTELGKLFNVSYKTIWNILKNRKGINTRKQELKGDKNPNWKGGIAFEPYCSLFNNEFKERVRDFWKYRCGICGKTEKENKRKLAVHHISYNKKDCCHEGEPIFVPLCKNCHSKTNYNREYWKEMLSNYIMIYFNGESYLNKKEASNEDSEEIPSSMVRKKAIT